MIFKFNVGLNAFLREVLSGPGICCDLVYKFKKLIERNDFSFQFIKITIGYNLNVMRQSACLVINPIMVGGYVAFFNCTPVCRASDSIIKAIHFSRLGRSFLSVAWPTGIQRVSTWPTWVQMILLDQRGYSEKSEIYYRLRFIFLPMFNIFGPI